jgi:hypothetical protein
MRAYPGDKRFTFRLKECLDESGNDAGLCSSLRVTASHMDRIFGETPLHVRVYASLRVKTGQLSLPVVRSTEKRVSAATRKPPLRYQGRLAGFSTA